jgi:putative ABC transport system permease protein
MITTQIGAVGRNIVMVLPEAATLRGLSFGAGSVTSLTPGDASAILAEVPSVRYVAPMIRAREQLVYGSQNWNPLMILGTSPSFLEIREWPVEDGSPITEQDVAAGVKVCLLGRTVADNLFHGDPAVDETIRIRNMPFRVAGILGRKGINPMGLDQDDIIVAPWTTTRSLLQGSSFNNLSQILVSTFSPSSMADASRDISVLLRQRHHLDDDQDNDFTIFTMTEMAALLIRTAKYMTTLLGVIASISLLVGGIGIMNVMFVSVVQRTHEIGLRMAVGATRRDILSQFLMEAGVLSIVAGLLGTLAGIAAAEMLSRTSHWPIYVSSGSVAVAFLFSAAVGLFFGFYPALRASRLDPIEALRHE